MPKTNFSKKIGDKNVSILVQSHRDGNLEAWGVVMPCPWCSKMQYAKGYKTTEKAAKGFWDVLVFHYNKHHKK
jgi:hypothetical protein